MAKVDITETTLPNGEIGNVGYISLLEDTKMTVYSDYLINNKIYTLSFYAKNTSTDGTKLEIIDGIRDGIATYLVTQEWNKVKLTFISNGKNVVVYFPSSDYYLYALKLEEGNTATTWTPSENDTKAETLQSAKIQYYKSTSATSMVDGEWSTVTPTWESGYYIWTRTMFIHQDGSILYSSPACMTGEKGDNGTDGTSSYTHIKYSANSSGNPMVDNPTDSTPYIGVYTGASSTAPTNYTDYVWSRYKGQNGTNGTNGTDGISIVSVTPIYYCTDNLINPPTTSTLPTEKVTIDSATTYNAWNLRPATWTTSYKYYFICSQIEYSDGTIGFSSIVQDNSLSKCVAEIITNTNNIGLKVSKGDCIADINASVASGQSEVKILADAISLEGTVTANGNFKILEDGSVEAKNGNFSGNFYANSLASERIDTYDELNVSKIHQTYDGDGHITAFTVSAPDVGPNGLDWRSVMRVGRLGTSAIWSTGHKIMDIQIKNRVNIMGSGFSVTGSTPYVTEMELPDVWPPGYIPTDVMEHPPFLDIWKNVINVYKYIDDSVGYSEVFTIDMLTGNVSCNNLTSTGKIKTTSGADLDTVKAKADGSLKSTHIGHATGTSSAFPSVDISSIKDGTIMRIEVGIPIDNTSTQTMAWFSTTVKKSTSTADYLYNCGGYYYSANYNASIFINVSSTRITINDAWTKVIGGANASAVNNLKSKATIYVYTENL